MQDGTEANYRHLAAAALLQAVLDSRSSKSAVRSDALDWLNSPGARCWAELLDIRLERLARVPNDPALAAKRGLWKFLAKTLESPDQIEYD